MSVENLPRAGTKEWIGLGVLALACILYAMDLTVLHLAVPQISADLKPTSAQLLWIIDIYGFFVAGSLITMGNLGDRIGRRKLLLIGALTFAATSVLAAFSTSTEMLIVARALLGISGATLAPSTLSLIRSMFNDQHQRTIAIGVWISSFSAGAAIGPLVGGALLEYFWWGSVFLLAIPIMAILLVLGPILLPEFRDPKARRLDLISAVLSLGAILGVIYGIKQIAQDGLALDSVATIIAGLVLGMIFLKRQKKIEFPLVDLQLFKIRAFSASLATFFLGILVAFGVFAFISQYLQLVLGLSPLEAGLLMLPWALAFVAGSTLAPKIVQRISVKTVIVGGLVLTVVGFGMLTTVNEQTPYWLLIAGFVISSLGLAPVFTLATEIVMGNAPPERAGSAAAISETTAELGGAIGIAVLGSIVTAIYRNELRDSMPTGISPEMQNTALDTLGATVNVVGHLPRDLGAMLLDAARDAFVLAVQVSVIISVVIAAMATVLAFFAFRNTKESQQPTHSEIS